eukprot:3607388-Prymnesium_polylepis.1
MDSHSSDQAAAVRIWICTMYSRTRAHRRRTGRVRTRPARARRSALARRGSLSRTRDSGGRRPTRHTPDGPR